MVSVSEQVCCWVFNCFVYITSPSRAELIALFKTLLDQSSILRKSVVRVERATFCFHKEQSHVGVWNHEFEYTGSIICVVDFSLYCSSRLCPRSFGVKVNKYSPTSLAYLVYIAILSPVDRPSGLQSKYNSKIAALCRSTFVANLWLASRNCTTEIADK